MTTLILALGRLAGSPFTHALGWTLLHFCWQGLGIAAFLAIFLGLFRTYSAQLRYVAACIALALMLLLPVLTFAYLAASTQSARATVTIPTVNHAATFASSAQPAEPWFDQVSGALDRSVPWIISTWCLGVLVLLGRLNLGLMGIRRMKSASDGSTPRELQNVLQALRKRLGIDRAVTLANSALVQVPTVVGWLRPAILMPVGCLAGLSTNQIEAILAHELAHIRRHDYLVSMFQAVAETLLFYHPAVWWVSTRIRQEREHCCDDLAVEISGDSFAYAKALSFLEERRATVPIMALGSNGGALTMRIRRLLGTTETATSSRHAAALLSVGALVVAALCIGTIARAASQQSAKDTGNLPAKYQRWINQDVVWIITPEERSAFLRLSADQERDEFMKQFWERRNPTPGSSENPAKDEHYRWLKYASIHFTSAKTPGWKGDRGRIYIIYGPPDEIEAHPSSASSRPTELWLYHVLHIDGADRQNAVMKFVDACNCGEYEQQFF